jgi:RHS repeat-associated protein
LDDAGAVTETVVRDAWGNLLAGASSERYGFAQREHDPESGLVYMRARMYDPRVRRFTQMDPIVGRRPMEGYLYGAHDPLRRVDPWGERWKVGAGPHRQAMLRDLERYTGLGIQVDADGTAWFRGDQVKGARYASAADMEWIWRVQNEAGETDLEELWKHVVNGDEWHRKRFGEAWVASTWGEYRPVREAFKQGNTWGIYQAPEEYQDDPAFLVGVWSWRAAQAALAVAGGAKLAAFSGVSMPAWVAGPGGAATIAAGPQLSQRGIRYVQVAYEKIARYLLSDPGKAGGFNKVGFTKWNWQDFRVVLQDLAGCIDVDKVSRVTEYGKKWEVTREIVGPNGLMGRITTVWQLDKGSEILRLVTAMMEPFK